MEQVPKEKVPAPVEERDRAAAARPREALEDQEQAAGKDGAKDEDADKGKDADKADEEGGGSHLKKPETKR
jgi:hypothetical protein